jgi:hypothetical protein
MEFAMPQPMPRAPPVMIALRNGALRCRQFRSGADRIVMFARWVDCKRIFEACPAKVSRGLAGGTCSSILIWRESFRRDDSIRRDTRWTPIIFVYYEVFSFSLPIGERRRGFFVVAFFPKGWAAHISIARDQLR